MTCSECEKKAVAKGFCSLHYQRTRRQRINDLKLASGCVDCPPDTYWPAECLDFDHVRGEKAFDIARGTSQSWKTLTEEISKCEVVCANHHRIRSRSRILNRLEDRIRR